jgi:GT2 family glycosyltransferase
MDTENRENRLLVSVIIVTCRKGKYLSFLLESLKEQEYPCSEVTVIDNSEGVLPALQISSGFPGFQVYAPERNVYYAEGLNEGIRRSKGEFILCLNDDVVLDKSFIRQALRGFAVSPCVGMVSGKILRSDRRTIDSTGLRVSLWRTACDRGYGRLDKGQFEQEGYIFGVNGAVAFYRREMLEQIEDAHGYFDSSFRMFYEDLDVSWRAQRKGWKAYYVPEACAYHVRGATARESEGINKSFARQYLSDELCAYLVKNRYRCIIKNEWFINGIIHLPFMLSYDVWAWGYMLCMRPQVARKTFRYLLSLLALRKKP